MCPALWSLSTFCQLQSLADIFSRAGVAQSVLGFIALATTLSADNDGGSYRKWALFEWAVNVIIWKAQTILFCNYWLRAAEHTVLTEQP
jgi:hypothetical protein